MRCSSLSSYLQFFVIAAALVRCVAGSDNNSNGKPPPNGDADCDCFLTNGTEPGYYAKHMFFDFRGFTKDAGVPEVVLNDSQAVIAPPTSAYFSSDEWTSVWELQGWDNSEGKGKGLSGEATVLMVNSPSNVYIQKNDDDKPASETYMTLRTLRLRGFQSAAAFQTTSQDYQFLSLRMMARTIGSPGAVTAMFTYRDATKTAHVQEADIEILTCDPREHIQYTNQPSYNDDGSVNPDATRNVTMPKGMIWSDWIVHRLDWTPQRSVWYVDGQEAASIEFQVPKEASGINFNAWSDGGSWSGNMSENEQASLQIQWIEMAYNTTGSDGGASKRSIDKLWRRDVGPRGELVRRKGNGKCKVVCSIDETTETGKASLLWNSTGARVAGTGDMGSRMVWIWTLTVGGFVWFWLI